MTTATSETLPPETAWRRWLRKFAAFEKAMEFSYDEWQDLRIDRIEAELGRLRAEVAALSAPSGDPNASSNSPSLRQAP